MQVKILTLIAAALAIAFGDAVATEYRYSSEADRSAIQSRAERPPIDVMPSLDLAIDAATVAVDSTSHAQGDSAGLQSPTIGEPNLAGSGTYCHARYTGNWWEGSYTACTPGSAGCERYPVGQTWVIGMQQQCEGFYGMFSCVSTGEVTGTAVRGDDCSPGE